MSLNLCPIILFFFFFILTISRVRAIGINWGNTASHPLPPPKVVELLKSNNITKVKLFDADPLVLPALSGSNIGVTVGIPNSMLRSFNSSKKAAESWVHDNVTRYFSNGGSGVRIEYVFDFFLFSWALAQWRLIRYCNEILGLGSFLVLPLMLGNENVGFFF